MRLELGFERRVGWSWVGGLRGGRGFGYVGSLDS